MSTHHPHAIGANAIALEHGIQAVVTSEYGTRSEQKWRDDITQLLDFALEPVEIKAAIKIAETVHEALEDLSEKPLKAELVEFVKGIRDAIENSNWEY